MSPTEKTIDLIKKLLAKANDEACTQEEAASFAAKAAELAAREQLELSDIDWTERQEKQPFGRFTFFPDEYGIKNSKARVVWQENLVSHIARAHQCRIILMGGNTYDICGRESNVEIVKYLSGFLVRFALEMSKVDYRKDRRYWKKQGLKQPGNFRASWYQAFVHTVVTRLKEMEEELAREYSTSTALVRLKDEAVQVQAFLWSQPGLRQSKARRGRRTGNMQGHQAGRSAGGSVNLNTNVVKPGQAGGPRRIG